MFDTERNELLSLMRFDIPAIREEKCGNNRSIFTVEPLIKGYGTTMGNALRRVLLNSIPGAAITSIRINGISHEFTTVPGMTEDVCEFVLNLKGVIATLFGVNSLTATLNLTGPCEVTAGDILGSTELAIVNPQHHLATLAENASIQMELTFGRGIGYVSGKQNRDAAKAKNIGEIYIDSIFSPITQVAYSVENARVGSSMEYDKLTLDVETDGSIAPADSVLLASKMLISHFGLLSCTFGGADEEPMLVTSPPSSAKTDSDRTIEELDLSVRSYNCLRRCGLTTVQELTRMTEDEVKKIRNLGLKSLEEIRERLRQLGLGFREE